MPSIRDDRQGREVPTAAEEGGSGSLAIYADPDGLSFSVSEG